MGKRDMELFFVVGYALIVAGVFLVCIAIWLDKPSFKIPTIPTMETE